MFNNNPGTSRAVHLEHYCQALTTREGHSSGTHHHVGVTNRISIASCIGRTRARMVHGVGLPQ